MTRENEERKSFLGNILKYIVPTFSIGLFIGFIILAFINFYYTPSTEKLISDDIHKLADIIKKIDDTAKISSLEHDINYIDFLNVKSFVGSEVGPLNLVYPDKWEGPYLYDNPTIQEKYYQINKAKDGYFIMPGHGVTLTNGNVIGKDIVVTPETRVQELIDDGPLSPGGRAMAIRIELSFEKNKNPFDTLMYDNTYKNQDIESGKNKSA